MGLFHWRTRRQKKGPEAGHSVGTPQTVISHTYYDSAGRRRRRDIPYLLPKDDQETRRLDYQQYVFRAILHGNCFAPVDTLLKNGCLVLDVGCGTGRWGCEIAKQYPASQVTGWISKSCPPAPNQRTTPFNKAMSSIPTACRFAAVTFSMSTNACSGRRFRCRNGLGWCRS
ncbi:MAG TPA: class I SAM-dependent methyltransferase [Ktedonobacteraceae bacterium]|nr:class I SAM-dependent methyltransferase [Ktedonobacteraceae bacterium]